MAKLLSENLAGLFDGFDLLYTVNLRPFAIKVVLTTYINLLF